MTMETAEEFESHRSRLFSLAYRMLGSASEAEDAVQDTYLRWNTADRGAVRTPAAWLTRVMTNLCINRLTSARARRELYVGPWLPEPVLTHTAADCLGPLETAEQRESVSFALLTLMERLTPAERAVFVLREAFGHSHQEIGEAMGIAAAHSRQLHHRARVRLGHGDQQQGQQGQQAQQLQRNQQDQQDQQDQQQLPHRQRRFGVDSTRHREIVEHFFAATVEGDMAGLEQLLAEDVIAWTDGGGRTTAALRPITGRGKVLRYLLGLGARPEAERVRAELTEANGGPAVAVIEGRTLFALVVPELHAGLVSEVRMVINPDKLVFAGRQLT